MEIDQRNELVVKISILTAQYPSAELSTDWKSLSTDELEIYYRETVDKLLEEKRKNKLSFMKELLNRCSIPIPENASYDQMKELVQSKTGDQGFNFIIALIESS